MGAGRKGEDQRRYKTSIEQRRQALEGQKSQSAAHGLFHSHASPILPKGVVLLHTRPHTRARQKKGRTPNHIALGTQKRRNCVRARAGNGRHDAGAYAGVDILPLSIHTLAITPPSHVAFSCEIGALAMPFACTAAGKSARKEGKERKGEESKGKERKGKAGHEPSSAG